MNISNYATAKEAAGILRISLSALHRLCGRGRLASVWVGNQRFIRRDQLRLLEHDVDYMKASRRFAARGKTIEELEADGQICLLSKLEDVDGESST